MKGAAAAAAGAGRVHVVGAGLAGLSAAVALAGRGVTVALIEGAAQAGGRCRSYRDPVLGMTIDNGNHLVLSGNDAVFAYLRAIGASDRLTGPDEACFAFHDVRDGRGWTLRPNAGPLAWWVLDQNRRVPGTRATDYLALAALLGARADQRVRDVIACEGPLWERLIEPFLLAALNTEASAASALLAGAVVRDSLARGGRAYRTRIATPNLSSAFIDPALAFLAASGAAVRFGDRLRALDIADNRVRGLEFAQGPAPVADGDVVILATPAWVSGAVVPGLCVPTRFTAIVNAHFRRPAPSGATSMVGVIGGAAQWIFAFPDRLSVTVSGANAIVDDDRETLARRFWGDISHTLGMEEAIPPWQVVKERRATFAATPDQDALRPPARTALGNLFLAGDWVQTGLPATLEGAIRSGRAAARLALQVLGPSAQRLRAQRLSAQRLSRSGEL